MKAEPEGFRRSRRCTRGRLQSEGALHGFCHLVQDSGTSSENPRGLGGTSAQALMGSGQAEGGM